MKLQRKLKESRSALAFFNEVAISSNFSSVIREAKIVKAI